MGSDDFPTERGFLEESLGTYEGATRKFGEFPFSLSFFKSSSS